MNTYRVLPGHSITDNTGKACTGGDTIDLDDAAAKQFAPAVEPVESKPFTSEQSDAE